MITIHWDFTDGTELSYIEGCEKGDNFTTNCLEFFNFSVEVDEVIVLRKDGATISRKNIQNHTQKQIRREHNIQRILVAGGFDFI